MLSEVLVANGEKDLVLFETFAETVDINLLNLATKKITFKKEVTGIPTIAVSPDNNYFVKIKDNYDGENDDDKLMEISVDITKPYSEKNWFQELFMLGEKGFTEIHVKEVLQPPVF